MRLVPEIMMIDESTLELLSKALDECTSAVSDVVASNPALAETLTLNGWTPRSVAWGLLLQQLFAQVEIVKADDL